MSGVYVGLEKMAQEESLVRPAATEEQGKEGRGEEGEGGQLPLLSGLLGLFSFDPPPLSPPCRLWG